MRKRSLPRVQSPCEYKTQTICDRDVDCYWYNDYCYQKSPIQPINSSDDTKYDTKYDTTQFKRGLTKQEQSFQELNVLIPDLVSEVTDFLSGDLEANYPDNPQGVVEIIKSGQFTYDDMAMFLNRLPNTNDTFNDYVFNLLRLYYRGLLQRNQPDESEEFLYKVGMSGNYEFIVKMLSAKKTIIVFQGLLDGGHENLLDDFFSQTTRFKAIRFLHLAARRGYLDLVRYFFSIGVQDFRAAIIAAEYGHRDIVLFVVDNNAENIRQKENLSVAVAKQGDFELFKILTEKGLITDFQSAYATAMRYGNDDIAHFAAARDNQSIPTPTLFWIPFD